MLKKVLTVKFKDGSIIEVDQSSFKKINFKDTEVSGVKYYADKAVKLGATATKSTATKETDK